MSDGLKNCPFCGHDCMLMRGGFGERWPECTNPECGIRFAAGIWVPPGSEDSIVEKWNDRAYLENEAPEDGTEVGDMIS